MNRNLCDYPQKHIGNILQQEEPLIDLIDPLSYTEAISRTHIQRQWNSRWQYPDFETNL